MRLFFLTKVLTIEGWHLVLTAIGVVIPIILMFIGIERSRKKDLNEQLMKKASVTYVKNIESRIEKMDLHYSEKTKELKEDFIRQVNDLNKKFDKLFDEVINVIKEKKDK